MIVRHIDCFVHCRPGALQKLWASAPEESNGIRAEHFKCLNCGAFWKAEDFSGAFSPQDVSCSNCYQNQVVVTKLRVEILESKDFE